jgi:hypothetical protein
VTWSCPKLGEYFNLKNGGRAGTVVPACNPGYLGSEDWKDCNLRPAWASSEAPISKITNVKRAGRVPPGIEYLPSKCEALRLTPNTAKKERMKGKKEGRKERKKEGGREGKRKKEGKKRKKGRKDKREREKETKREKKEGKLPTNDTSFFFIHLFTCAYIVSNQ